jgi:hypothetical protein
VLAAPECAERSKNLLDWLDLGDDPPGAPENARSPAT